MSPQGHRRVQIEQQYGKPLEAVILEKFEQFGSVSGVARSLLVAQPTVSQWIKEFGYKVKTKSTLVKARK